MTGIIKSGTRKFLERKDVKLNQIPQLAGYLRSRYDKSIYGYNVLTERSNIVSFLDKRIEELQHAKYKELAESTGDFDPAKDEKRMKMYRDLIHDHGVNMRIMMDVDSWTLENAERLHNVGVEVRQVAPPYELHAGVLGRMVMFTLHRVPVPGARKVVGESQKDEEAEYMMVVTNNKDFVEYTQEFLESLWKKGIRYEEVKKSQDEFVEGLESFKKLNKTI